jgi:hypothetical protein
MGFKKYFSVSITVLAVTLITFNACKSNKQQGQEIPSKAEGIPQLVKHGNVTQLYVDGKPFLILGGELNNSTSSSIEYMKPIWKQVADLNFNTMITPLSWELIEPEKGKFDFNLVDSLIAGAREHQIHIVFLWLASWKNGMSSYMPLWVKENYKKFPRIKIQNGITSEVLSTFSETNVQADAKAFSSLMKHIREVDGSNHTVLMMQVENEAGILGDSRDRSEVANQAFSAPVPNELIDYLVKNKEGLVPEIKLQWGKSGFKTSGNWEEIFGKGAYCDEIFMAWNYSCYINKVAEAGKKEYPIPMYANAWLDQEGCPIPGWYPSGGPLAHVLDIWLAGIHSLDILAPDVYVPDYENRCQKYTQRGNPLFIPEMQSGDDGARNVFIAIGSYNAIGVSPFGIDLLGKRSFGPEPPKGPKESGLSKSYDILRQISPLILEKQASGEIVGFVVDEKNPIVIKNMGGYRLEISLDEIFGHRAPIGYGIVMADGLNKFTGAGCGFRVRFSAIAKSGTIVGVGNVDEGIFGNGKWIPGRRLNGDEDDQGRAWRFAFWKLSIEKCTVYKYE